MDENKKPQSVVFYVDWYNLIKKKSPDIQLKLYQAITEYAFEDKEPTDELVNMVFDLIKNRIDGDFEKYREKVQKRQEAGRAGGLKKAENQKQNVANVANATDAKETVANVANNINNNSNNNKDNNNILITFDKSNVRGFEKTTIPKKDEIDYDGVIEYYNKTVEGLLPQVSKLTKKRKEAIHARYIEYGKEAIAKVIQNAASSTFLIERHQGFDWYFCPNNFPKVLEGNYNRNGNNRQHNSTQSANDWTTNEARQAIAEIITGTDT